MNAPAVRSGDGLPGRGRLAVEFALLFLVAPVVIATLLPPAAMWASLLAGLGISLLLLWRTPGFRWREAMAGPGRGWWLVPAFGLVTAAVALAVVAGVVPRAFLGLVRRDPLLWLAVMALYPLLSALPQEIMFRLLFFRRYGALLPRGNGGLVANAAIFALAHLLYWNWIVAALAFLGGLVFAWAHARRGSFLLAVALHAVAGNVLFTVGAGTLFFTGNIVRPF